MAFGCSEGSAVGMEMRQKLRQPGAGLSYKGSNVFPTLSET